MPARPDIEGTDAPDVVCAMPVTTPSATASAVAARVLHSATITGHGPRPPAVPSPAAARADGVPTNEGGHGSPAPGRRTSPAPDDHHRHRHAGLQPRVQARPHHPQPARHGRLQAPHAADDLEGVRGRAGDVLADQPLAGGAPRGDDRRDGASRAARPRAHGATRQEGTASGWPATPSTARSACSRRNSWAGSGSTGCPNTTSGWRTDSSTSTSAAPGPRSRCGRSRCCPS